jgi:hypothetical protein
MKGNKMSYEIDPNTLYTREWIVATFGSAMMNHLNRAGLRAIADKYLGAAILAALTKAHEDAMKVRRQAHDEKAKVEENTQNETIHGGTGRRGAIDVLRKMAQAQIP